MSASESGPFAELGRMHANGCRVWARSVNRRGGILGRRVVLLVSDDGSQPARAKAIYEQFIDGGSVDLVMGPYSSIITGAVAPVTEQRGFPMLAAGGAADELWSRGYRHLFGLYPLTSRYAVGMLELLGQARLERIALLAVDDAGTQGVAAGIRRWASAYGLRVTYDAVVAAETRHVAQVSAARASGAQALMLAGRLIEAVQLRRALKEIGWSPVYYVSAGAALPRYLADLGRDAEGTFGTSLWEPREDLQYPGAPDFLRDFAADYGGPPSYHAALCFAAGQILEQALLRVGSVDRAALTATLSALDTVSIIGRYAVDRSGAQAKVSALIVQWQHGKREIVWPQELQTAKARILA